MATTAKRTCQGERDELRFDALSGEMYETGCALLCTRPIESKDEDCRLCERCREELE